MKVLFIGGTGIISSACSPLAIERSFELFLFNRGQSHRPIPAGAQVIQGDIRDSDFTQKALGKLDFDVVVDWIAFKTQDIERDIALFRGRVGQYIFISSASAYQKPPAHLPVSESTPLDNPFWEYSRNKAACEEHLVQAYRQQKFPMTIVRPSHTYDKTLLPTHGGYTMIDRMRKGKQVIVHGDGTSLWTLTHHKDFSKGFVGLFGNPQAIGQAFHITSDEWLTWNQIHEILARAARCEARLVHVPSEVIAAYDPEWGAGLLGDKAHSMIFDNSKIKRLVPDFICTIPFARGAEEIIDWYDADPARRVVDPAVDSLVDRIIGLYSPHPLPA
jgi:nucleoside-diphosphate-sugar epimerase